MSACIPQPRLVGNEHGNIWLRTCFTAANLGNTALCNVVCDAVGGGGGACMQAPPLLVTTNLTTEEVSGSFRQGHGKRMNDKGVAR